jgi:hypothetical protein
MKKTALFFAIIFMVATVSMYAQGAQKENKQPSKTEAKKDTTKKCEGKKAGMDKKCEMKKDTTKKETPKKK